jgi:hypothetical protein
MIPPELEQIPASKADIVRLEGKMDQILELQVDVKWLKRSVSGAYVGLLTLLGMK